jgi:DegV family protein with EDD domain
LSSSGRQTAVVADSTVYLPAALQDELEIATVSLYVSIDGEQQPESEITDYPAFYERLRAAETGATTSQPSIGDFCAVYEPLLEAGREIVSVHLSAGISGTCEAAGQARERLIAEDKGGERIQVVDSRSAAGGMSLVVIAAGNAARAGFGGDAVVAKAEEARENLKIWFGLDTLEYLRRGGRIGGAAAFIGSALQIKPILTFEEEVTPVERVRTRARSIERLRDYARQRHDQGADAWTVQHIQSTEAADALIADCREIFGCEPVFVSEVGAVLGAHAGPGMLGVGSTTRAALSL